MSETKYCINCGKAIPTNATFCPFCGATQDKVASTEDQNTITSEQHNTPNQPEHVNMWTALKLGMRQTFTWSQRITRPQYWWLYLDLVLISLVLTIVLGIRAYSYPAFILSPLHVNALQTVLLLIFSALMVWTSVMQFTASARRLHDSNRSAHYLWFYLLPLVGPILIIVFLCQRSEPAGKRFDRLASQPKPWTHKWWTWCLLVLLTLGYAALINITARDTAMDAALTTTSKSAATNSDDSYSDSDSEESSDSTDSDSDSESESDSDSDSDSITIGDDDIDIADQKAYSTSFTDSSWAKSTFKIDKVTVYKTDGTYTSGSGNDKKDFNGVVKVHMSIHAGQDISAYPTQAKLSTNDGQQVEADMDSDDFDGDLNSGTDSDGNVYFVLSKLSSVKDITSIRLKWDASYDTDDYDDDNAYKTFDTTLNLN